MLDSVRRRCRRQGRLRTADDLGRNAELACRFLRDVRPTLSPVRGNSAGLAGRTARFGNSSLAGHVGAAQLSHLTVAEVKGQGKCAPAIHVVFHGVCACQEKRTHASKCGGSRGKGVFVSHKALLTITRRFTSTASSSTSASSTSASSASTSACSAGGDCAAKPWGSRAGTHATAVGRRIDGFVQQRNPRRWGQKDVFGAHCDGQCPLRRIPTALLLGRLGRLGDGGTGQR